MGVHQLSQAEARQIAIRAQLLDEPRPTDVIEVLRHLGAVNLDPTAAIAPAADLILWSRLGSTYDTDDLRMALEHHVVVDHRGVVRPSEDMALYRVQMAVSRILYDDRLVGKLDAKADGKAGVLTVFAIHQDTPFELRFAAA